VHGSTKLLTFNAFAAALQSTDVSVNARPTLHLVFCQVPANIIFNGGLVA